MKVGVVFPQTEIGPTAAAVRRYALTVEELGFDHIATYDHVLGASERPDWPGFYTVADQFHEVLVMYGYIAAITSRIELATEVLVLPQRQTALVAKQAAEVDLLSGGRLRLGVGLGWNWVEYEALGMNFHDRGKRIEEQVAVLRELWSKPLVSFQGGHHGIADAGLNPLPGRSIPIWLGTTAEAGLRRAARIADGWQSELGLGPQLETNLANLRRHLAEFGRDADSFGIAGEVGVPAGDPETPVAEMAAWAALGATHVSLTTMGSGFRTLDEHLAALTAVRRAWLSRSGDRGQA